MNDDTTNRNASSTNRRVSRRALGLLAAAAATSTLGLAAMTTASGATDARSGEQPSLFERGSGAIDDLFSDDDWGDDCPGCGLG